MKRTHIKDLSQKKGEEVVINCWIDVRRDQGKMAFFDFRDASGSVQGIVFGKPEVLEVAKTLRPEWVVAVEGHKLLPVGMGYEKTKVRRKYIFNLKKYEISKKFSRPCFNGISFLM